MDLSITEISCSTIFSELYRKEIAELREKYDLHMRVERYVSDTDGIPQKDSKYIRQ